MQSAIAIILVLGGLIFFHELGHFIFARLFGVGVKTFSLGFGPKLFGITRGKTEYRLSAVPLGGYVSMVGEQPDESLPEGFTSEESFTAKPAWQRSLIAAAGPFFNFFLAFLIYWVLFLSYGKYELVSEIGQVQDNSPAAVAGLQAGDRIVGIDGQAVAYWDDFAAVIRESGGKTLTLSVERDGEKVDFRVTPEIRVRKNIFGEDTKVPMIGIVASGETEAIPLSGGSSFIAAGKQTWNVVSLTVQGIVKLVERIIPLETIGGPIMIAQMVSQQAQEGWANVLALAAVISVNLGLLNLLPIPVLDGGHIIFFAIEAIIGKPLSPRWRAITIKIGIAFLLGLMTLAIYNDLHRLFTSNS